VNAGAPDGQASPPALDYRINWDILTPYAGDDLMLLHINGKFTMGKLMHLFCRKVVFFTGYYCHFRGVDKYMGQT
jgi:hypothetical protein